MQRNKKSTEKGRIKINVPQKQIADQKYDGLIVTNYISLVWSKHHYSEGYYS